jgi:hypothetical protein
LLFLSSRGEATVDQIQSALKLGAAQRKGLSVALSVAKKDGLLAKGGERGSWKISAKGKEHRSSAAAGSMALHPRWS